MAKTPEKKEVISLSKLLSTEADVSRFKIWLVGDTPLITHAWSQKAKLEMLQKQVKATKGGKQARDPQADFVSSLYEMGDGVFGFPVTAIKLATTESAHKDKGLPRTVVEKSIWFDAEMVRIRPALAGAICDMPLVRIHGSKPEMREDMVRVGSGLNKTATLAYRAQFTTWAIRLTGHINSTAVTPTALAFLIREGGMTVGIGEWRLARKGMFGSYHLALPQEEEAWEKYAAGKGALPVQQHFKQAAE